MARETKSLAKTGAALAAAALIEKAVKKATEDPRIRRKAKALGTALRKQAKAAGKKITRAIKKRAPKRRRATPRRRKRARA